jgi:hypothetical protein
MTDSEVAERDAAELAQDHKEVVREWQRYKEDGLASEEYATDLIRFWDVSSSIDIYNIVLQYFLFVGQRRCVPSHFPRGH